VEEDKVIDPESVKIRNRWLYDFDAEEDAARRWLEVRNVVEAEFARGCLEPLC
jgi:salicylate hydroxylase